jgi:hypothetical protein
LAASGFGREDAIGGLIIFGIIFPLLAWWTTLRARRCHCRNGGSAGEMWLLIACLLGVTLYLIWGAVLSEALVPASWLASPRVKSVIVLIRKLIVFVVIPFLLFRIIFGYRRRYSMALAFGLAHAPGFILRGAGLHEAIGTNPSAVDSIAYAIVVLSFAGIFFGIVWARTKNLFAVMF